MRPTCAVIPAAGKATRLYPLTYAVPKELLPVGPFPAMQHVVAGVIAGGITDIIVVTAEGKGAIREHFDIACERGEIDATFTYVIQEIQRGLGDAVATARAAVGDRPFVVALGDALIVEPQPGELLRRMQAVFEESNADAVVVVERIDPADTVKYGIVAPVGEPGDAVKLCDLVEKPEPQEAPSNLAICGRYVFRPAIFDYIAVQRPGSGGEIQLTDALANLTRSGGAVYACPLAEGQRRLDIGNLRSYYRAVAKLAGPLLDTSLPD